MTAKITNEAIEAAWLAFDEQKPTRESLREALKAAIPLLPIAEEQEVEAIAWIHTITEPDKEPTSILSRSPNNPWSHWIENHKDKCTYSKTPLYTHPQPVSTALVEAAREAAAFLEYNHFYTDKERAHGLRDRLLAAAQSSREEDSE